MVKISDTVITDTKIIYNQTEQNFLIGVVEVARGGGFVVVCGEEVGGQSASAKLTRAWGAVHGFNYFKVYKF